ncbi:hypothetical protein Aperf_G00000029828 [Anoplocephala perfoliata]
MTRSKDDTQVIVPSPRYDSIPSLSNISGGDLGKTMPGTTLTPSLSSPLLAIRDNPPFSDSERDVPTVDSGFPTTHDGNEDVDLDGIGVVEEEVFSDNSDLFSLSPNLTPSPSSNEESLRNAADYHSVLAFDATTSINDMASGDSEDVNSSKNIRERYKRTLSNWYQVKRESFVKSFPEKLDYFKKIFADTPVNTDRFLVAVSHIRVFGLISSVISTFLQQIYAAELYIAVDDVETVSKAKTARFIPNAIEITLKSDKERYFFTSFYSRERTFAFLTKVHEISRSGGILYRYKGRRLRAFRKHRWHLSSPHARHNSVANMEDLLCQVHDVYGDEYPNVLNFAHGNDETLHPSNRNDLVTSTSELNVVSTANSSQDSPNSSEPVTTSSRRPQSRYNTHGRNLTVSEALPLRSSCPPGSASSPHLAPTTAVHSLSFSGDLIEDSNVTATSTGSAGDEAKEGIEMNFAEKQSATFGNDSRPKRETSQPAILHRKLESARPRRSSSSPIKSDNEDDLVDPDLDEKTQRGAVSCGVGHQHPGRTYAAVDINVSVDALFTFLFTDSHFFENVCEHRGTFDMQQEPWPSKPWRRSNGTLQRNITYVLTLKQKFCPRHSRTYETQTILLSETRPGMRYVVDCTVKNESVPFCNSFHATTRYCLLRRRPTVTHLIITCQVIYDRPLFFAAKSIIESVSHSTMSENFNEIVDYLGKVASSLSTRERITGGSFALPRRPRFGRAATDPSIMDGNDLGCGEGGSGGIGKVSEDTVSGPNSPSTVADSPSSRGLFIPRFLLSADRQLDRRWLFMIAIILGLSVLLSVVYNRYRKVERIAADHLELTPKVTIQPGSTSTPQCDELDSMRLLFDSVTEFLSQMRTTMDLLEHRLNQLSPKKIVNPP